MTKTARDHEMNYTHHVFILSQLGEEIKFLHSQSNSLSSEHTHTHAHIRTHTHKTHFSNVSYKSC